MVKFRNCEVDNFISDAKFVSVKKKRLEKYYNFVGFLRRSVDEEKKREKI